PVVVQVKIEGHSARALIDSGLLGDFMSATLAEQLNLRKVKLERPIDVHLAVQGSRTKVKYGVKPRFKYQEIDEKRHFDIINLSNYDLILGIPFLFQHQILVGLNPFHVVVGSNESQPMEGKAVNKLFVRSLEPHINKIEQACRELKAYALQVCKSALDTPLPPLRKINHRIPLIEPEKRCSVWRVRFPDPLKPQWIAKRNAYIKPGRCIPVMTCNAVPMLYIMKPGKGGEPPRLRTVVDLQEHNANTKKMACPLLDMDVILKRVA
ncbi:hypothetical protein FA15DRAFT_600125, partial [Coprinopsis marcescibilis]